MTDQNSNMIRWGIIGCGNVTELKSGPAYQKTSGFELAAVMRRNKILAEDYARRHQVPNFYGEASEVINNPNIDAIYIATPPDSHKSHALTVAKAGKPCCIEKPLSPSYQDSLAIVQAFKEAEQPLFVAYYRRSLPRFNKIKALIEDGAIGKIRHISWLLTKPTSADDLSRKYQWRTDKKIALGGYFDDLASHGLDLFAFLLGDYTQVKGVVNNQQQLYTAYDAISATWQHKSGVTGVGSWNFGTRSRKDQVTIYGSEGELSFSVFQEQPVLVETAKGEEQFVIEHPENIQLYHVLNMKKHLEHQIIHPSNGDTALHTSWMMDEILKG